jgi:hypothetical protein
MKDCWKALGGALVHVAALIVVSAAVFVLMRHEMMCGHNIVEGGLVENAQLVCAALSGLLFLAASRRPSPWSRALLLTAMALLAMSTRELDAYFDRFFHGAWAVFAVPFGLVSLYQCVFRSREVVCSLASLWRAPAGRMLELSTVFLLVFSRLIGTKRIWVYLCEDEFLSRAAKNLVEEGTELFGYALLLLCAVEVRVARPSQALPSQDR